VDRAGGGGESDSVRGLHADAALVQLAASIPATALFPVILLFLIHLQGAWRLPRWR